MDECWLTSRYHSEFLEVLKTNELAVQRIKNTTNHELRRSFSLVLGAVEQIMSELAYTQNQSEPSPCESCQFHVATGSNNNTKVKNLASMIIEFLKDLLGVTN